MSSSTAKKTGDADANEQALDPLLSDRSLEAAGFRTSSEAQQKFLSRLMQRAYQLPDLPSSKSILFGAAAALCGAGAGLLMLRGAPAAAGILGGAGVLHAVAFGLFGRRERAEQLEAGKPSWTAAHRDTNGTLLPRLDDDERLVLWRKTHQQSSGRAKGIRIGSSLLQTLWGTLLGGLPIAVGGAGGLSIPMMVLLGAGTFIGTAIFGRGIRTLFFTKDVEAIALTNRRLVLLADTGAARSFALADLAHRPTVVKRDDGTHTLAFDIMPLASAAPLPMKALVGLEGLSEDEAKEWAGATMDERIGAMRARLAARMPD